MGPDAAGMVAVAVAFGWTPLAHRHCPLADH